ncbi:MAG: hypothetical protein ABJA87_05925 [bacterium]
MELELMPCPICLDVTLVEIPPCLDEHGGNCPDRACTVCGAAFTRADVVLAAIGGRADSGASRPACGRRGDRVSARSRPGRSAA